MLLKNDPLNQLLWQSGDDRSNVYKIAKSFGNYIPKKAPKHKYSDNLAYRAGYQAGFERAKRLYINRLAQLQQPNQKGE